MPINHEQQYYTGYEGHQDSSQDPHYEYSHDQQHAPYTTTSQQPYGQQQPVQVFVQFTHGQPRVAQPFDGSRIAAALSYSVGWLTGILFFLFSDGNRYVRFHALQSLLFFGFVNAFDIVFIMSFARLHVFAFLPYMQGFAVLFFLMVNFIAFVGWLIALFQAARGAYFKLPIVGEIVAHLLQDGPPDMVN